MTNRTSEQALADAAASIVSAQPSIDVLTRLVEDCAEVLEAQAVAILVTDPHGRLSLLASSSSAAAQLELLQAQDERGPCIDVLRTGEPQTASGAEELMARWDAVGTAILDGGFLSVRAYPMTWHGHTLGGLNLFFDAASPADLGEAIAQASLFADVATIALVHATDLPEEWITSRVRDAVTSRDVIEQAKGALAHLEQTSIADAASRLREIADGDHVSLSEAAARVLTRAASREGQH